jgi:hypothetical protein
MEEKREREKYPTVPMQHFLAGASPFGRENR